MRLLVCTHQLGGRLPTDGNPALNALLMDMLRAALGPLRDGQSVADRGQAVRRDFIVPPGPWLLGIPSNS